VVQHKVEHQVEVGPQALNVVPLAVAGTDRPVVDDGEAVVARPGEEGQDVDRADEMPQALRAEAAQCLQGALVLVVHHVGIGDQDDFVLVPARGLVIAVQTHAIAPRSSLRSAPPTGPPALTIKPDHAPPYALDMCFTEELHDDSQFIINNAQWIIQNSHNAQFAKRGASGCAIWFWFLLYSYSWLIHDSVISNQRPAFCLLHSCLKIVHCSL
jgi:hypothetical protein